MKQNITLIGMSGVGKSSLSKSVSKTLQSDQIDTDTILRNNLQMSFPLFIKNNGEEKFLEEEERTICSLSFDTPTLIATGGSCVYSKKAMDHLKSISHIIYLKDSIENIKSRIENYGNRGVIGLANKSVEEINQERLSLYSLYADSVFEIGHPYNFYNAVHRLELFIKDLT
ncbi:shikimate kinase [bacterium]|jgi:shikimate kinase|nr:shikimate kinase [bacterium]